MIFSALRFCVSIAWDAGEALADWLNCNRAVDSLWAQQHTDAAARLADVEAEQEVTEPECTCPEWGNPNWPHRHGCPDGAVREVTEPAAYSDDAVSFWHGERSLISPTAGVAPNPVVVDAPQSTQPPTTAGHPKLRCESYQDRTGFHCTRESGHVGRHGYAGVFWDDSPPDLTADELDFASFAIRRYADSRSTQRDELYAIADKLDPAK